jgi:D-aminopeptidase
MEVEFVKPLMAEYASKIPLVKRKDVKSVAYKAKDAIDAFRAFEVMMMVARNAKDEGEL